MAVLKKVSTAKWSSSQECKNFIDVMLTGYAKVDEGFGTVRQFDYLVLDAQKAGQADGGTAYVRFRTRDDGEWLKSSTSWNNGSVTTWHSEKSPCQMRFLLRGNEVALDADIMDTDAYGADMFLGSARFLLSEITERGEGKWQTVRKQLIDGKGGSLSLELCLGTGVSHLSYVCF